MIKSKRTTIFLLVIGVLTITNLSAQVKNRNIKNAPNSNGNEIEYKLSSGFRGGIQGGGLTLKYFLSSNKAVEGLLSRDLINYGTRITALYEIHKPVNNNDKLKWFYGTGIHIGSSATDYFLGIDAIYGLEYKITEIPEYPFTIGLDAKPCFDFINDSGQYIDFAVSIRYIID